MVKQPVSVNGVVRWKDVGLADQAKSEQKERKMVVLVTKSVMFCATFASVRAGPSVKSRQCPGFPGLPQ